jgi:type II secretory pathway component PulF
MDNQNMTNVRPLFGLWVITALLVFEAIGTSIYVPQYLELYESLSAELPFLTKLVLMGAWGIWILPFAAFMSIVFTSKAKNITSAIVIFLFVIGIMWVPLAIYGLYLPIWEMGDIDPT